MNRVRKILSKALVLVIPIGVAVATMSAPSEARADVVIEFPSSAYIATAQPEYFEGRPVYYFHNQWYYRDGGRWRYYRSEPGYLRERRGHWNERERVRYRYHR